MTKIVLQDLSSLVNETSALATMNSNSSVIEIASDNFLSRDGTTPNQMGADLDMNSHRILNIGDPLDMNHAAIIGLDDAVALDEPVTLNQLNNAILTGGGAPATIPYITVGNTGSLPLERALAVTGSGLTLTDGGANGSITVGLDGDLNAVASLSTTGLVTRTAANTMTTRSLTQPAAGLTISNNDGVSGNPTLALANDLSALEGLSTTGVAVRTATDTWTTRTITGTANEITLTNGDGVSGNPTVSIPTAVTFTGKTVTGGTFSGPTITGTEDVQQNMQWSGDISPTSFSTQQDNYNPSGLSTASCLRLTATASSDVTGLSGGSDGRILTIHNIGAQAITLKDESASSTAANRFALTADITMTTDMMVLLQYDSTSQRWRAVSGGGTGGGSGTVSVTRRTITGADTVISTDRGNIIEITSGTFTLAFTAAATLTNGFYTYIYNSGTGDVTLDPNGAELIDGLTTWVLYPGGAVLVMCTGSAFESVLLAPMRKQFDANGTFTTPGVGTIAQIEGWGAGGSGGKGSGTTGAGGGGGGARVLRSVLLSSFTTTVTITVGTGGASQTTANTAGNAGNNTTVGSLLTAFGGGGGDQNVTNGGGGGGGGGALGTATTPAGGQPGLSGGQPSTTSSPGMGAGGGVGANGAPNSDGGAGGGAGSAATARNGGFTANGGAGGGGGGAAIAGGTGGNTLYGGAGGGGGGSAGGAGGTSSYGGNGGAGNSGAGNGTAGTQPGGGGGGVVTGNSGAGGDGRVIITIW